MLEPIIIISNNPLVQSKLNERFKIEFMNSDSLGVFKLVRDYVHKGHKLLTHPLVSSLKPNEIPYRTVVITKNKNDMVDYDSLMLIESSISTTEKFINSKGIPKWNDSILTDFQVIDYDIITNALKQM